MAKFDSDPKPPGSRLPSDQPPGNSPGDGSDLSARPSASLIEGLPQDDTMPVDKMSAEDDLLVAVTSISSEALTSIDHTLDRLTGATDLFDIPAIDLDA